MHLSLPQSLALPLSNKAELQWSVCCDKSAAEVICIHFNSLPSYFVLLKRKRIHIDKHAISSRSAFLPFYWCKTSVFGRLVIQDEFNFLKMACTSSVNISLCAKVCLKKGALNWHLIMSWNLTGTRDQLKCSCFKRPQPCVMTDVAVKSYFSAVLFIDRANIWLSRQVLICKLLI